MVRLCVNIDHIATLRQARGGIEPDPVVAAGICELAGCAGIVVHLREDRRHIQERDLYLLKEVIKTKLNLEMSINPSIVDVALDLKPDCATLVPERRRELTTEGGLDVLRKRKELAKVIERLRKAGIQVSLFIDAQIEQVKASQQVGAEIVELHTGRYANASAKEQRQELEKLRMAKERAREQGLRVSAGHGLNYQNVWAVARIEGIEELNIGHSIISRAVLVGLERAVKEMKEIISSARE
ncbi:MAG: pyridoxine 5'-phosphate synthase [Candidatus Omnitrophota bacterium]|nr:MAG: pyridoxine 5'-phosphate synthase [Candidatus Omnitrophota bacterium]